MDKRLRAFTGSRDGVYAVDAEQRIVFWNDAIAALLGISATEAVGQPCWQVLHGTDRHGEPICSEDCLTLQRAREGETLLSADLVLRRDDEAPVPTRVAYISPGNERTAAEPYVLIHLVRPMPQTPEDAGKLRIQLLGPAKAWLPDGSEVVRGARHYRMVRCLLGYLAMRSGQVATQREIQESLWPGMDESKQRASLRAAVAALRSCLEDTANGRYVSGNGAGYRLSDNCWVDAVAFDTRIHRARLELDASRAISLYQEALALYGGYYLAELEQLGPWCLRERARLHKLFLAAMEELGLLYESVGLTQAALTAYYRLLQIDPDRPGARRHLFRLAGAPGGEIAAIRTCMWLATRPAFRLDEPASRSVTDNHNCK